MKKIYPLLLLLQPFINQAQNLPACDSLVIQCCTFDSLGPNTLTLFADNHSLTEFYSYPNFVLFNATMDTIAKETVTYFGIGWGFQPHTLDIRTPIQLPFSGKLNLYKDFYVTQCCSWPIYIPDTTNGTNEINNVNSFEVFPNPAKDEVVISLVNSSLRTGLDLFVFDTEGRQIAKFSRISHEFKFETSFLQPGIYFLKLLDPDTNLFTVKKLAVE